MREQSSGENNNKISKYNIELEKRITPNSHGRISKMYENFEYKMKKSLYI